MLHRGYPVEERPLVRPGGPLSHPRGVRGTEVAGVADSRSKAIERLTFDLDQNQSSTCWIDAPSPKAIPSPRVSAETFSARMVIGYLISAQSYSAAATIRDNREMGLDFTVGVGAMDTVLRE